MDRFHKVILAVDTETILANHQPGEPDNPTRVEERSVHAVTGRDGVPYPPRPANNTLSLKAEVLDAIRWHETSLSVQADHTVLLYGFVASSGDDLISGPRPLMMCHPAPLPNPDDPVNPDSQTVWSHFWHSTVKGVGFGVFSFWFMILNRKGEKLGYYYWDLGIKLSVEP